MTIIVHADYTLGVGQTVSSVDEEALSIRDWQSIVVDGLVTTSGVHNAYPVVAMRVYTEDRLHMVTLTVGASGVIRTTSTVAEGYTGAIAAGGDFELSAGGGVEVVNHGVIEVQSPGEAGGVDIIHGAFKNDGRLTVTSKLPASAVEMSRGGVFINSGEISVTGGSSAYGGKTGAVFVQNSFGQRDFINSGAIRAISVDGSETTAVTFSGFTTIDNSGTIEGTRALVFIRDTILYGGGRNATINNTGALNGAVYLNNYTGEPVALHNSGQIHGDVTLNLGPDTYNGADGILVGAVYGNDGSDLILGGRGSETLSGDAGNDTISGGGGADYLRGGEGDDSIVGGSGFDDINGNAGNDTCVSGGGDDWVVGGKGNDSLVGSSGQNLVYGNLGNDTCDGGAGNDIVRGGQDNDSLMGGAGDDFVSGDKGDDTVMGGAGADIFHTFGDAGIDRVLDFHISEGDRVQLDPGTQYTAAQVGADTVISMIGGGQMILVGVTMTTLPAGWIFGA